MFLWRAKVVKTVVVQKISRFKISHYFSGVNFNFLDFHFAYERGFFLGSSKCLHSIECIIFCVVQIYICCISCMKNLVMMICEREAAVGLSFFEAFLNAAMSL